VSSYRLPPRKSYVYLKRNDCVDQGSRHVCFGKTRSRVLRCWRIDRSAFIACGRRSIVLASHVYTFTPVTDRRTMLRYLSIVSVLSYIYSLGKPVYRLFEKDCYYSHNRVLLFSAYNLLIDASISLIVWQVSSFDIVSLLIWCRSLSDECGNGTQNSSLYSPSTCTVRRNAQHKLALSRTYMYGRRLVIG